METKSLLQKGFKYITNESYRITVNNLLFDMYHDMSDEKFLKKIFRAKMGYELDLEHPTTFNEKLQWLKLYDRKPIYTKMVDKYEVKSFVAERIGERYIIPTLGVWDHFDEIDFSKLPDQFVLKCTHDSGGLSICTDKKTWNKIEARKLIERSLKRNYYYAGREWPYKDVKPRVIAEKLLKIDNITNISNTLNKSAQLTNLLIEYKLFCFYGEPKWFLISMGAPHGEGRTNDIYDINFNHMPVSVTHPNATFEIPKPKEYEQLIWIARELSKGIPQLRVDTYIAGGQIYVGELTFYHSGGFCQFKPKKWDKIFGDCLKLPTNQEF